MTWHVLIDSEQRGPFERDEIAGMVGRGEVTAETLVWTSGMSDWVPAASVDELSDLFRGQSAGSFERAPTAAPGGRQRLQMARALGDGLRVIGQQPLRLIGVIILYAVVGLAAVAPFFALMFVAIMALSESDEAFGNVSTGATIGIIAGYLVMFVITTALYGGVCAAMLDAVRGTQIRFSRMLVGLKRVFPLLLYMLITSLIAAIPAGVIVAVGNEGAGAWSLLVVLPALVFVAVSLILGPFYIIDAGAGPLQAVGSSFRAVLGLGWFRVFGTLLVLVVLAVIVMLVVGLVVGLATMAAFSISASGGSDAIIAAQSLFSMVPQILISIGMLVVMLSVLAAIYEQARSG